MIGQTIAHYTITEKIGQGGMGEVYRATDTKLKRDVALKVLPKSFTQDLQRMARFTREAQVLASLNHANIGAIHGLEEQDGVRALVLELIEGEDLSERIAKGPIPLEEALQIALQIAEALEAAHEKGIIHRDLKPANVKITPEGQVKVLDFGLAKALDVEKPAEEMANSPTLTMQATQAGLILGTAAYMSPEQARGRPTDRRTDIWAFGTVLFEMLSGKRAFGGEDVSMVLASVLKQDLNWARLPDQTPKTIQKTLERCLTPELRNRFQAIGDARFEMESYLADPSPAETHPYPPTSSRSETNQILPWALVSLLTLAFALVLWSPWTAPFTAEVTRLSLSVPLNLRSSQGTAAAFSPDGKTLAFTTRERDGLYLQRLDQTGLVRLPDTEGAVSPFFSPDGDWIAYFDQGSLKKISIRGGTPQTLCAIGGSPHGGTWSEDGTIVFSGARTGLYRIAAVGGDPEAVTQLAEDEFGHRWPDFLPGAKTVLMTRRTHGSFQETRIEAVNLADGQRQVIQEGGAYHGRYASTGHLVFMRESTLFAVPFDPDGARMLGTPIPVLQDVLGSVDNLGAGQYAFSEQGSLIYQSGSTVSLRYSLLRMNRQGEISPLDSDPAAYRELRLSPDGKRLALTITDGNQEDIWIDDLGRQTRSRLTFDRGDDFAPLWTPDGEHVIFTSSRGGPEQLYRKRFDATGDVLQLTDKEWISPRATSISSDGKYLAFSARSSASRRGITILTLDREASSRVFLVTDFREDMPVFSPSGRWLAYKSNETGRDEIYVRSFPEGSGKRQISPDGGNFPFWSSKGRELFFYSAGTLYSVSGEGDGSSFQPGRPQPLFTGLQSNVTMGLAFRQFFDLAPDAQSVVLLRAEEEMRRVAEVILIQNWFEELKRLVPGN